MADIELDRVMEQARVDWGSVGMSVAAVRGDEVVYAGGFGAKELGKHDSVDADTLFQVGSTTKAFTAAALAMLVAEGRLGWDDPILDYVPDFSLQDPWVTRNATVRDALAHRCGVFDTFYYVLGIFDAREAIRQLRYVPLQGAFRDSFSYSNLMYAVAGRVIEAITGMSWHQFLDERLLQPLQMTRSSTSLHQFWDAQWVAPTFFGSAPAGQPSGARARAANIAMPHGFESSGAVAVLPWQNFDYTAAAGGLVSSASDMAKWLVFNLNGGVLGGKRLIESRILKELHSLQNLHAGVSHLSCDASREGYAMGWWRSRHRGHTHLSHGGNMIGFPAYAALLPDQKLGVVVLSNGPKWVRDDFTLHKFVAYRLFDHLLGKVPASDTHELLECSRRVRRQQKAEDEQLRKSRPGEAPSLPLLTYAGIYEDSTGRSGQVEVHLQGGALALHFMGEGAFSATLEHWHRDVFRLRCHPGVGDMLDVLGPQFVTFTLDATAKVASMSAFGSFGGTFRPRQ